MAAEVTAATQLVLVCNPNNPTGTHRPAAEVAAFCEALPAHVTAVLDEAYIEFQAHDDPDATVDLLAELPNLVVLRTFSKVYGLAGLRVGYALGAPKFRAAVDAVRQPFSVNALAQAAGAEAILHQDDVSSRVERTVAERLRVEEGLRALGLETSDTHANFSWIDLGDAVEADVVAGLAERSIVVRPGTPLGDPGHIRVSYGTAEENTRFLAAIGEILA
jgi:histidinol-phosphate aminotransferase